MKFTVNTNEFKTAIEKVITTTTNKAIPTLENIHVTITNNNCRLHATDLTTTIISNIKADAIETIDFILGDVKNVSKALKFFNEHETVFNIDDNILVISCGNKKINQKVKIETVNDEIFPCIIDVISDKTYTYNINSLKKRFNLVNYAVMKNDSKPVLTGIHFNGNDMVTVDGFRLAVNSDDLFTIDKPITIPETALKTAINVLDGDININIDNKYIFISDTNTTAIIRLLDGEFHNYKNSIPTNTNFVDVDVKDFTDALKYLKTFITEKNKAPIQWFGNELKLKTAQGIYEVSINTANTTPDVIGFNCNYMLEALTQFADVASISIEKKFQPILIKQDNNTALVLPVSIKDEVNFKAKESA